MHPPRLVHACRIHLSKLWCSIFRDDRIHGSVGKQSHPSLSCAEARVSCVFTVDRSCRPAFLPARSRSPLAMLQPTAGEETKQDGIRPEVLVLNCPEYLNGYSFCSVPSRGYSLVCSWCEVPTILDGYRYGVSRNWLGRRSPKIDVALDLATRTTSTRVGAYRNRVFISVQSQWRSVIPLLHPQRRPERSMEHRHEGGIRGIPVEESEI